jgi:hypothetical protein
MIIIALKGGLGNQLFQYACGRALQLRQEEKDGDKIALELDATGYAENNGIDALRHYALSPFNIQAEMATREEIKRLKYPYGIFSKGWRFFKARALRQYYTYFVPRILKQEGDVYLDGYFQTEKYFIDKEETIRADLTLKTPFGPQAQEASMKIKSEAKSVSLHVRHGDMAYDPLTNRYWGTCSMEYYAEALKIMHNKIGDGMKIFVFSDDIAWVKENMTMPYPVEYVSAPGIKDYEELSLMSLCKNNIIANSSFSWWGAWLNGNPDKMVIAPEKWTNKEPQQYRDIIPSSWLRI